MEGKEIQKRYKVFLSHVSSDKWVAQRIAHELSVRNIDVWLDTNEIPAGASFFSVIKETISASDYIIILLSNNSVNSSWVHYEIGHAISDFSRRDITLLPVRLDDCEIPFPLANHQFLDLRGDFDKGIDKLAEIISAVPEVDFKKLSPRKFESLVGELLWRNGFENVQITPPQHDTGVDFIAEYKRTDPFGAEIREVYLVQLKLYRQSRADLNFLRQSVAYLKSFPQADVILLVTNSHITSAASEWLHSVKQNEKISVRVIDGTELKRLLLKHNDLVQKYFSADEETGS